MESTSDVQGPGLLLSNHDGLSRDLLAPVQDPLSRAAKTVAAEVLSAGFTIAEPVAQSPSLGLFL